MIRVGMATIKPHLVVIRASEIPEDRFRASPVPTMLMSLKVLIIPVTVPRSPTRGAALTQIFDLLDDVFDFVEEVFEPFGSSEVASL